MKRRPFIYDLLPHLIVLTMKKLKLIAGYEILPKRCGQIIINAGLLLNWEDARWTKEIADQ